MKEPLRYSLDDVLKYKVLFLSSQYHVLFDKKDKKWKDSMHGFIEVVKNSTFYIENPPILQAYSSKKQLLKYITSANKEELQAVLCALVNLSEKEIVEYIEANIFYEVLEMLEKYKTNY